MENEYTSPTRIDPGDETPDSLMNQFKGRGLSSVIMFTVIVHVVVLVGSSIPFLMGYVFGEDTSDLSEADRIKAAVAEATPLIRKIADKHGLNPQQLSAQFAGGGSRTNKVLDTPSGQQVDTSPESETEAASPDEPEEPKSAIEKELDVKRDGPQQPTLDEEKDIF